MDKIKTDVKNAKWHTLWKKRMESGKPREGDYNFIVWREKGNIVVEPFDRSMPPSVFENGQWRVILENYG